MTDMIETPSFANDLRQKAPEGAAQAEAWFDGQWINMRITKA